MELVSFLVSVSTLCPPQHQLGLGQVNFLFLLHGPSILYDITLLMYRTALSVIFLFITFLHSPTAVFFLSFRS